MGDSVRTASDVFIPIAVLVNRDLEWLKNLEKRGTYDGFHTNTHFP